MLNKKILNNGKKEDISNLVFECLEEIFKEEYYINNNSNLVSNKMKITTCNCVLLMIQLLIAVNGDEEDIEDFII